MAKIHLIEVVLVIGFIIAMTMEPCLAQDNGTAGTGIVTEENMSVTMVPPVDTALCISLTGALTKIVSESPGRSCTILSVCSGLLCDFGDYFLSVWVLPCAAPPASRIVVYSPEFIPLFDDVVFNTTGLQGPGYSMQVVFDPQDGEFGIEINDENVGNLFPYTTFSTDPSHCFQSVCEAVSTSILASEGADDTTCSLTSRCDGAICLRNALGITMTAKIVQCHEPPAVQLIIDNPFDDKGRDLLNEVFTTTSNRTLLGTYQIFVTIHQLGGGIGVEIIGDVSGDTDEEIGVELPTFGENFTDPFFPEFPTDFPGEGPDFPDFPTDFPEEPTGDNNADGTVLRYTFFPIDQTKPECEVFTLTCLGLQDVVDKAARSNVSCRTNEKCNGVECLIDVFQNGALFPMTMIVNSCKEPMPSVDLILKDTNDKSVLLDREVDSDDIISIFMHDIHVTVEQLPYDEKSYPSIGFAIDLFSPPEEGQGVSSEKTIIPYTEVPVICDGINSATEIIKFSSFSLFTSVMIAVRLLI